MDNTEKLNEIVNELSNIEQAIANPKQNSYGGTIGDTLYDIEHQLSRIADSLEKTANK